MTRSWTSLVALVLCAVAAVSAAMPEEEFDDLALESAMRDMADSFAESVQVQTEALLGEFDRHTAVRSRAATRDIVSCASKETDTIVKIGARLLALVHQGQAIAQELIDFNKCEGNVITSNVCRMKLLKQFLSELGSLKSEASELLKLLKAAVKEFKECIKSGQPATDAPAVTDAPAATGAPADADEPVNTFSQKTALFRTRQRYFRRANLV